MSTATSLGTQKGWDEITSEQLIGTSSERITGTASLIDLESVVNRHQFI
jgi:hypothetical protein